jgi:hypothetical protein
LALARRGASAVGRGEAEVLLAARELFRDVRRHNASEGGHPARLRRDELPVNRQERRNAQRCQERRERTDDSGRRVLRDLTDASAAGRLRRAERPLQAEQQKALQVEAQRTVEQAMASVARRPQAAVALPQERWEWPELRPAGQALAREPQVSQLQARELSQRARPARMVLQPGARCRLGPKLRLREQALSSRPETVAGRPAPQAGDERPWRLPLWQLFLPGLWLRLRLLPRPAGENGRELFRRRLDRSNWNGSSSR